MAASIRNSEEEIPAKKIKLTNEEGEEDSSDLRTFRGFRLIKVLNENAQAKTVAVHGERLTFPVCNLASSSYYCRLKLFSTYWSRGTSQEGNVLNYGP